MPDYKDPKIEIYRYHYDSPLFTKGFMDSVIGSANVSFLKPKDGRWSSISKTRLALLSLAAIFFLTGAYFSLTGFKVNQNTQKEAANLTNIASKQASSSSSSKTQTLSTAPITSSQLADYVVAPNLPRYLMIPELNIKARILSVGLTSSGAVDTPVNIYDTAWYNESAQPGQPGAVLIDGHVSSWTAHGVFYDLHALNPGDDIQIQRGDGTILTYKVVKSVTYPASGVNMQSAMTPVIAGQPGLNLITCAGQVISGTSSFSERLIVYTTQVSS